MLTAITIILGVAIAVAVAAAALLVWIINDTYKTDNNDFNY